MGILQRIERRLIVPGDSETRQSQKKMAVVVMVVATVFTLLSAFRGLGAGFIEVSWIYFAQAAAIIIAFFLLLAFPGAYLLLITALLATSYLSNMPAHLLSGGFTNGMEVIIWILLPPVIAVLFVGRRSVFILTLGFIITVLIAAYFEPLARGRLQAVDIGFATFQAASNLVFLGSILIGASLYLFGQIERYRQQADSLLLNILPAPIARRLKISQETIADNYEDVTVLFADIVDFTTITSGVEPVEVVNKLNAIFSDFDALAASYGLEKIKTVGDAYMVAGGLPEPHPDHCRAVVAFAVDMLKTMEHYSDWSGDPMRIRIGINTGPVVAGVIGRQKFIYDLWGDVVNVASRMESNGLPGEIQVTRVVRDGLEDSYRFEERGPIPIKGKGEMITYLLRPV